MTTTTNTAVHRLVSTYALSNINQAATDTRNGTAIKPVLLP